MPRRRPEFTDEEKRIFEIARQGESEVWAYVEECREEIENRLTEIEEKQKEIRGILWHLFLMKTAREHKPESTE